MPEMPILRPIPIPTRDVGYLKALWNWITKIRKWELIEQWQFELPDKTSVVIPAGFKFDGVLGREGQSVMIESAEAGYYLSVLSLPSCGEAGNTKLKELASADDKLLRFYSALALANAPIDRCLELLESLETDTDFEVNS